MKKTKVVLLVILSVTLFYIVLPKQKITSDIATNIEAYLKDKMKEVAIPGMAVAVIKNNKIVLMKGYGYANVKSGKKVGIHTPFNLASISKPVMGIALMRLVDRGLLDLDKDINTYLPFKIVNPKVKNDIITMRHLATHTSSINDYYDPGSYAVNKDAEVSLSSHIRNLLTPDGKLYAGGKYFKNVPAGTVRDYSNLGAGLAGLMLESITKKSLADFTSEEIFRPLEMKNTSWRLADFELSTLATGYNVKQCIPFLNICADVSSPISNFLISKLFNPPFKNKSFIAYPHYGNPQYPDGGLNASVYDLTRLVETLLNKGKYKNYTLLSEDSFKEMFSLQLPKSLSTRQRFFWRDNKAGMIGHSGSDLGVFTSMYFDLENRDAVIILMNRDVDAVTEQAMGEIRSRLLKNDF